MRTSLSHLVLDVHSSSHSNHDVSQQRNTYANDDITIEFIYSSDDSVPSAVLSYSYCVTSSVENYSKSQSFFHHRARTSHRTARLRRRLQRLHQTRQCSCPRTGHTPNVDAARYNIRISSQRDDAGYRAKDTVRHSLDLRGRNLFYYHASIGVAAIRLPY